MISKSTENGSKRDEIEELVKFFNIDLKTDEEIKKMSKQKRMQYQSRVQRWQRLIESQIDFEVFKSLYWFKKLSSVIAMATDEIQDIKADPQYEQNDGKYKTMIEKIQMETNSMAKKLAANRKEFDDIYIPYKKLRSEEMDRRIKQELIDKQNIETESDSDSDIKIKDEYISEDEELDTKCHVSDELEIKEEYFSGESDVEDKDLIKKQIKTQFDIKQEIKSEVKTEIKEEFKVEIKEEFDEEF